MKSHIKVFAITISTLGLAATGMVGANIAHSLTFSQDIGVSFTINPSIAITLSSADLVIPSLAPGTASDSNVITINIKTNSTNGYTVNTTVGNDSTFDTRDLIHSNSTIDNKFASVDYGSSYSINTDLNDNTWAYSYSVDNGTNWIANTTSGEGGVSAGYSGLPLYSDETNVTTLKSTNGPVESSDGDNIKFKIAAKASSDQVSGEYNNVINFTATAQVVPMTLSEAYANAGKDKLNGYYKLQDMNSDICNAAEVIGEGSEMQAIDIRDNKVYWITKLADNKCWFTQNLDHDIVTTAGYYTHDNTDLGWGSDTATTSWTPTRSTIDATNVTNNSIPNWTNDYNTPYSVDPGDVYWNSTPFYASVANLFLNNDWGSDPVKFQKDTPFAANGTHGHVGNYYNWSAAVASNNTSSYTSSTLADISASPQNSICPAGWRLPTITSAAPTYTEEGSNSEFARLANLYANYTGSTSPSSEGLEASPLYFVRAGLVYSSRQYSSGGSGYYWSSAVRSSGSSYYLDFDSANVCPQYYYYYRNSGFSVRCVAR